MIIMLSRSLNWHLAEIGKHLIGPQIESQGVIDCIHKSDDLVRCIGMDDALECV